MRVLYAALFVLFLLHNDLWLWHDASIVAGLPVGLLYHLVYCLVTSVVLALLVTRAWPYGDETSGEDGLGEPSHQGSPRRLPESGGEDGS